MNTKIPPKVKIQLFTDHRNQTEDQLSLDKELRETLNRIGDRLVCSHLSCTDLHGKIYSIPGHGLGESVVLICKISDPENIIQGDCYTQCGPVSLEGITD